MSELKIDEKFIQKIAKEAAHIFKAMIGQCEILKNKEEDVFARYMAMHKVGAARQSIHHSMRFLNQALIAGHDIHHKVLQTDAWKEGDWDKIKLENNPFFIDESDEDSDEHDCAEAIKELLEKMIK